MSHPNATPKTGPIPFFLRIGVFLLVFGSFVLHADGQNASKWLAKGDAALAAKEYAKAIDYYEWAERKSGGWKASLGLATAWRARMDYSKALEFYAKVVDVQGIPVETYFYHAQALMVTQNYPEAERWFANYAASVPSDPRAATFRDIARLVAAVKGDSGQYELRRLPINSKWSDFSPAFFENGILFVSSRPNEVGIRHTSTVDDAPLLDLFYTEMDSSGKWSKPKPYAALNTKLNEGPLTVDSLQGILFLTRNDPSHKKNREKSARQGLNRLQIDPFTRVEDRWVPAKAFPFNNVRYAVGHPAISPDGQYLYFASDMPGGFGGADLYRATWDASKGEWLPAVNLGPMINTSENELFPYVDSESQLYFSSNGHLGLGGLDLFYAQQTTNGDWSRVQNLGYPLNSEADDFGILLYPDGNNGLISSNRGGVVSDDNIYSFQRFWPKFECTPQLVNNYCYQFWETGVIDSDTMPLAYEWNFGDGFRARGLDARHCFQGPGDYLVSLNLIDTVSGYVFLNQTEYRLTVSDTEQVYIDCPDVIGVGEEFSIDGGKSILNDCSLEAFFWEMGDGHRETLPKFTYQYEQPGRYEIKLGVTGTSAAAEDWTCKGCVTKTVEVLPTAEVKQLRDSLESMRQKEIEQQSLWDRPALLQELLEAGEKLYDMRDSANGAKYSVRLLESDLPIDTKAAPFDALRDLRELRTATGFEVYSGLESEIGKIAPYFFEGHRAGFNDAIVVMVRDSSTIGSPKPTFVQIPAKKTDLGYTLFSADVVDAQGNPLNAEITFEELNSGLEVVRAKADSNGRLEVRLPNGDAYAWYLGTTDFFPASGIIDLLAASEAVGVTGKIRNKVTLSSIAELVASGESIRINNVFFDYDATTLRPESKRQLDRLASLLVQYQDFGVSISAHTDDRGDDAYNLALSRRRADAVLRYLDSKGFSSKRITSEGFGERKPAVPNDSDENRQFNRRVEFSLFPITK